MAALLKPGQGPLDYTSRLWLKILFAAIYVMLYIPIVTLIAFSFNTDKRGVVWRGFTLDNYTKAWNNSALIEAMTNSLMIAFIATIFATVIGAMVALTAGFALAGTIGLVLTGFAGVVSSSAMGAIVTTCFAGLCVRSCQRPPRVLCTA